MPENESDQERLADRQRVEDERLADRQRVEEEAEAAAAEAGHVGGDAPVESDDPSQQPLIESGQGESEGFELAEQRLRDIASHGDEHRFPDRDVLPPEDPEDAEFGEADESIPPDG
jgi:hypothetical protein